ncbi:alpha/beta fold hydrolase [Aquamicrobium sp. LC103]|uniref:alpha/beta hydrolase n=1 Tax=Aquamicrobium sp. LC103 TaxID=1120658 RepID=UPI00069CAF5F|nr:alpha/beta fold hydrolase [Aquamicrobium sp. LC103]TKT79376.1 alpha/beta hydrolase [Aquamicrobium sp. LC103]
MEDVVRVDGGVRRRLHLFPRRIAVAAALLLLAGLVAVQTVPEFILYRERLVLNLLEIESNVELQPVDLSTHDGLLLRSWYHPPAPGKPVIVYFPGRLGDLIRKPAHLFGLAEQGYGLMLAGYRGYGGNPGRPSEHLLYRDAAALLTKLTKEQLAPDGIVLYGYSMGTGIASYVAMQGRPRAVILEAPFTSFPDAVHRQASSVPLWLVRTRFDTRSRIGGIDVPILLLAGQEDAITPPAFAEALASLSEGFSKLYVLPEANHINMIRHGAREIISGFLFGLDAERAGSDQAAAVP